MPALYTDAPLPAQDPIANPRREQVVKQRGKDTLEGLVGPRWLEYFTRQAQAISQSAVRIYSATLTSQAASIGATDLTDGTIPAGLYLLTYHILVTRVATTSSSLIVGLDWVSHTTTQSFTGGTLNGNLLTTMENSFNRPIYVDAGSPVRYSVTYASSGATAMQYRLDVALSRVNV